MRSTLIPFLLLLSVSFGFGGGGFEEELDPPITTLYVKDLVVVVVVVEIIGSEPLSIEEEI